MLKVWLKRLAWVLGTIVLLYVLAWAAVPPLLKWQAQTRLAEMLGRGVTVGEVHFKPWTLELTVADLAISGAASQPNAQPLLKVARVHVDAAVSSLWHLAPVLEAVQVDAPQVQLARTAPGRYDIDDLIAKFTPQPEPAADDKPSRFALYNLQLRDGRLRFDDQPVGQVHEVDALQLTLPFLSNLPADVNVTVEPRLAFQLNGTPFDSGAQATPFAQTREGSLTLAMDGLDLAPYLGYLPESLPVRIQGGQVSARLSLHFTQPDGAAPSVALRGSVGARELAVADVAGAPLLGWQQATLALRDVQPLARRLDLESLRIEGAQLWAARDGKGVLNWSKLATPASGQAAAAPPPATAGSGAASGAVAVPAAPSPWQIALDAFELADARVRWNDASVQPAAALQLDGVSLSAQHLHWPVKEAMPLRLAATVRSQGKGAKALGELTATGSATDRDAKVALMLSALSFDALAPYLAQALTPSVEGRVSAKGALDWSGASDAPRLKLTLEQASLDGVQLHEAGSRARRAAASLKQLALAGVQVDVLARQVTLGRVTIAQPSLAVARDRKGQLNVAQWLVASPDAPRAESASAAAPWQVQVDDFALEGGALRLTDAMVRAKASDAPTRVELSDLRVTAGKLGWPIAPGAKPVPLKLGARIAMQTTARERAVPTGTLAWNGQVGLDPLSAQGSLRVQRFPLQLLEPYLPDPLQIRLVRAEGGYDGKLRLSQQRAGMAVDLSGDVLLGDVRINSLPGSGAAAGSATEDELLSWQSLALKGFSLALKPASRTRVEIDEAALDDFFARLVINERGRFNLQELAGPAPSAADAAASAPESPSASAAASAPAAGAPASAVAASAPGGADALPLDIRVGKTQLADGRVDFSDHFIKPNYSAALTELKGELGAFSSDSRDMATLELHGRAAGTALLSITGKLNPTTDPLAMDIQASATDLELAPLSPYAGKYAGYAIDRGKLTMNVAYRIDPDGKLQATNQLVLNQLTFGDKVDSPSATKLPVLLAVALLKDRNGVIDINLPISGSLNDPQFSIGGIVLRLIGNLLAKALTAPFALLAGGGGGDDLSIVEFVPGTARLAAAGVSALDKVAKALTDRPSLKMTVTGRASPDTERDALRGAELEARLQAERRREGLRAGAPAVTATESQALSADERARLVKRLYDDSDIPDKPRNALGFAKRIPVEEMETLLKARLPAAEDAMRELALQRGLAVRDALVAKGLSSDRLFLAQPKLRGADDKEKAATPSAQLSLSVK